MVLADQTAIRRRISTSGSDKGPGCTEMVILLPCRMTSPFQTEGDEDISLAFREIGIRNDVDGFRRGGHPINPEPSCRNLAEKLFWHGLMQRGAAFPAALLEFLT